MIKNILFSSKRNVIKKKKKKKSHVYALRHQKKRVNFAGEKIFALISKESCHLNPAVMRVNAGARGFIWPDYTHKHTEAF